MRSRRDSLLIVLHVLRLLSNGPAPITHIANQINLNHGSAQRYLSLLEGRGFLQRAKSRNGRTFLITEKGIIAMKDLSKAVEAVSPPIDVTPWQGTQA